MSAPVDGLLRLLAHQNANELQLGTGRAPRMFAYGTQKRLAMPETTDEELRHLLGALLSTEREQALHEGRRVDFAYDGGAVGVFQVAFAPRAGGGFDVVFVAGRGGKERAGADAVGASGGNVARPATPGVPLAAPSAPSHDGMADRASWPVAPDLGESRSDPAAASAASPPDPRSERLGVGAEAAELVLSTRLTPSPDLVRLIQEAVELRASDVHLCSGEVVRIRVDGRLRALESVAGDTGKLLGPCLDAGARARIAQAGSADVAFQIEGGQRVRASVYRASEGLAAALRILPGVPPPLASLGLPVAIDDLIDVPHGLVIACGPTGCGKSTMIAALLQEALRRRPVAIVTLEDPIEYSLVPPGSASIVRQRQVGRDVRDFATGLRDALRSDPDIIFVGEMRDPESIALALTAAETGHLVLTTLHSRSTSSAIDRILDTVAPERQAQVRSQLADSLRAIIAQRLLPRARGSGRVVALEVLRVTHAVAHAIREGRTAQIPSAIQSSRREGMIPLERCLADLVRQSAITVEAARAVASETSSLESYLRGAGAGGAGA